MTIKREETGRDDKGRFSKGYKGGGRPKTPEVFKELVREKSMTALQRVIGIVEDPASDPKDVLSGARLIIEYAYGKPAQDISNTLKMGEMGDFKLIIKRGEDSADA